jgi:hypothetical protein
MHGGSKAVDLEVGVCDARRSEDDPVGNDGCIVLILYCNVHFASYTLTVG